MLSPYLAARLVHTKLINLTKRNRKTDIGKKNMTGRRTSVQQADTNSSNDVEGRVKIKRKKKHGCVDFAAGHALAHIHIHTHLPKACTLLVPTRHFIPDLCASPKGVALAAMTVGRMTAWFHKTGAGLQSVFLGW